MPKLRTDVADWAKGLPAGLGPKDVPRLSELGLSLLSEDLPLPAAVIKRSALDNNRAWMRRFLAETGAKIAPHGKTSMSPQLFQMQLEDGAWSITAGTPAQVLAFRKFGVPRIFLANQLVGRTNIELVLDEMARDPGFDFYCIADSLVGVEQLARAARERKVGRPLQVLVEVGAAGCRTGVRSPEEGIAVARAVKAAEPHLSLRGVETFEGMFPDATLEAKEKRVAALLADVKVLSTLCYEARLYGEGPVILTAGGTDFFDLAAKLLSDWSATREVMVLIRSGCYLTHDDLSYQRSFSRMLQRSPELKSMGGGLRGALEVWAYVHSRPEQDLAFANVGKRDLSYDIEMPKPLAWFRPGLHRAPEPIPAGHRVTKLNDQHAYLALPDGSPLQVGDLIAFGISHVCTTFDKWPVICLVDDDYRVIGAVRTYF